MAEKTSFFELTNLEQRPMQYSEKFDIAVLGAVLAEIESLLHLLEEPRIFSSRLDMLCSGMYRDRKILVGTTGVGKVNAAITTASLLQAYGISEVWNIGCAGAFQDGPLRIGDVLVSETFVLGDEGVLTEKGIVSPEAIGIPLLHVGKSGIYDRLPLGMSPLLRRVRELTPAGSYRRGASSDSPLIASESQELFKVAYGPSLTVGMVSGDPQTAAKRFETYAAYAENMEGSAVAQTCFRFGVPVLECRGVSNMAGDRCKDRWDIEKAVAHCHEIVLKWLC